MSYRPLKFAREGDILTIAYRAAPPAAPVSSRHKRRMKRWTRLVKAAAYAAAYEHVGKPCTRETVDEVRTAVLDAMRATATRYGHLKQ